MGIPQDLLAQITEDEHRKINHIADILRFAADQPLTKDPDPSLALFPQKHQMGIHRILQVGTDLFKEGEPTALTHAYQTWVLARKLAHVSHLYEDVYTLALGALLHDIGKILIPIAILGKPSRLNNDERTVVRRHPLLGAAISERLGPFFARAVPIVLSHHEEWGGAGYPQGLLHTETPIEARIVHLADVVSALSVDRVYREKMPPDEVREVILRMQRDRQAFDPTLIRFFDEIL